MGIKYLDRILRDNCGNTIKKIPLSNLYGKEIVIDISIYMYKFAAEDKLIENMYLMLMLFRTYNIIPIFVFDGKSPPEKMKLVEERRKKRMKAREEYDKLRALLSLNPDMDLVEKQNIIHKMHILKRNCVYISKIQRQQVKDLILAYGATYYDAPGEADEICAILSVKNTVWACMSEDMDMFVYGCPRIIKYLDFINHTVVLYDLFKILNQLGITQTELREICVLSGTDYNMSPYKCMPPLYETIELLKEYKNKCEVDCGFYSWLIENTKYTPDCENLYKIISIFDLSASHENINMFENIKFVNSNISGNTLQEILKDYGFLFE